MDIAKIQEMVRSSPRLTPRGAGTKTGLNMVSENVQPIDISQLNGVLDYQPEEYTFTALAGTRLAEVNDLLRKHRQYLPFDPPLVESGATLGGTVAAGISGPGRYRFGGLRDFLLGVKFINSKGELVRGGGKVVKNSAGFDLPKLFIGSLGQYGVLVELSFKVFPRPHGFITQRINYPSLSDALADLMRLSSSPIEIFALELVPNAEEATLFVRLAGAASTLPERIERLRQIIPIGESMEGEAEAQLWHAMLEFSWLPEKCALVKVPITPKQVPTLEASLNEFGALHRYSVGANLAWIAWQHPIERLHEILVQLELCGLVLLGKPGCPRLGVRVGETFAHRVKRALDPDFRWVEV